MLLRLLASPFEAGDSHSRVNPAGRLELVQPQEMFRSYLFYYSITLQTYVLHVTVCFPWSVGLRSDELYASVAVLPSPVRVSSQWTLALSVMSVTSVGQLLV